MLPSPSVTVAAYSRISVDPGEQRVGVTDQAARLTAYAHTTWPGEPVRHYHDNDLTASDPDVDRPGYRLLLDDVRAGDITRVCCVEQSRLTRQPAQWEQLCTILTRAGIGEVHTLAAGVVSVAPASRLLGRILAAVDAEESERVRARTLRALERNRAAGRPPGGPCYGYLRVRDPDGRPTLEPHPEQAPVVADIFELWCQRWSLHRIAQHLDDRGVPTPNGAPVWRHTTVRRILARPTVAGLVSHHGTPTGPGVWPAIIDPATWEHAQTLLTLPARWFVAGTPREAARTRTRPRRDYLLAGIATCAICGQHLRGDRSNKGRASYACRPVGATDTRCGRVHIRAEPLEEEIDAGAAELLDDPHVVAALAAPDDTARTAAQADLDAVSAQLADLAAMWGAGSLTAGEWHAARTAAQERAQDARRRLAELPVADRFDVAQVAASWASQPVGLRRLVLARLLVRVDVWPARDPSNAGRGRRWAPVWAPVN